jgi:hypothetical protein
MKTISTANIEIVPAFDYTWRCDCEAEGHTLSLKQSRREAKEHLKVAHPDTKQTVFIDEYDLSEGKLSDRWWKVRN